MIAQHKLKLLLQLVTFWLPSGTECCVFKFTAKQLPLSGIAGVTKRIKFKNYVLFKDKRV